MRIAPILAALMVALPVRAADSAGAPAEQESFFKRAGKAIAQDAKAGINQAGKAYAGLGRSIGRGTVNTTKQLGTEIKDSSKRTAEEAKKTF